METILSASTFKAHCLEFLEKTRSQKMEYIVTKRGKPMAKLIPIPEENHPSFMFGGMQDSITIKGNILSPIDVAWDCDPY